ncbi:non-ribosomal peptide synthetase [Massilia sp. erpn]|uniref:non-ribosomal peptide synthetase n=1 Tax=Massilia sp. erpn TaxID=2738142 RepID=UPI0021061709|nr:non-ribosomal peptide synthetase [Massilia sp. erpn]UTY57071.1 amino acid adenylation domain-containing protein [Massilia sp. erpn]
MQRDPTAAALADVRETISYGELNQRANRLAHYLLACGIGRGDLVAIHLERSIELITCVLAVLKTGAAYVPLPVELPLSRLQFILRDTGARAILSNTGGTTLADCGARLIGLAQAAEAVGQHADTNPALFWHPQDIAYCIYTSGSTGQPKGVQVPHAGIAALRQAQAEWFGVGPADRVLQFASFGFDAFVFDLVMAFGAGAMLVLRGPQLGAALVDQMVDWKVSIATLPPALLLRTDFRRARYLRCVISAGEACKRAVLDALPPNCELVNAYGPSETTIWASSQRVTPETGIDVPIGHAVAQMRIDLLDQQLRPVAAGQSGEIVIAGPGLARGYLGQPSLTAERFVPDPFGEPGARMYRSGDLGRQRADGAIEFLGRIDNQLKIRGYRVEPGEIENALLAYPGVREAAVVARDDAGGHRRLVAYLVSEQGQPLPIAALRSQLQQSLPEYMVPAAWLQLDALPMTPNGKIDHSALPAPALSREDLGVDYVAPSSPTQQLLAAIWSEILGIERIGIHDGFRTLGGSSLQAVDVAYRVDRALGASWRRPIPFGNTTIAAYAALLDQHSLSAVDIGSGDAASTGAPASYAQEQVCFLERLETDAWRAYRCHALLDLRGPLRPAALEAALNALVARHEILRTSFGESNGRLQRLVAPQLQVVLPCRDLSALPSAAQAHALNEIMARELEHRFDLAQAPLVRWELIKLSEHHHQLLQTEHHNVHDGLSFRILLTDLGALYSAACQQRDAILPVIEAQYGEYCLEELRWRGTSDFQRQLDAWQAHLRPYLDNFDLFSERRRTAQTSFTGGQVRGHLTPALVQQINQVAALLGVSRYALMLAAFGVLCGGYSQKQRFMVGSALANRTSPRYQWTTGMFVNMVPVGVDLGRNTGFSELAQAVSANVDFALAHGAVPLGEIVKKLALSQQLEGKPPFSVGFSFHDSLALNPQFEGLQVAVTEALPNGSAKFDLSVVGILTNRQGAQPLELLFEYNADLFDPAMVAQIMDSYRCVLEAVVAAPATPLRDLPLQAPDQARRLLADFNQHAAGALETRCLHQLFELQVARTPSATALLFGEQALSYAELNLRANRLAHALRADGVGPDTLVGLCVERGCDMVVGMLAILKAGGAYVPLDPDYPAQRLAYMLDDTRAPVLLLQRHLAARLPPHAARVHWLDEADTAPGQPDGNPPNRTLPQHLAYCIYTSGSTGGPKGAINTHQGVANLLAWYCPGQAGGERIMLASSLSFDLTQKNILGPLLAGATLVIPCGGAADVAAFQDALQRHRPSRINCAPSAYRAYMEAAQPHSLRTVVLGGEPIDQALAAALAAQGIALVNSYGPTECADVALFHRQEPDAAAGPLPLGRPLPHVRVYVLDAALVPVPPGVAGEIHIAGSGLARGYLNRPGLSADRFIPDPYGPPGSRMYRTGDLGRHTSAGTIEFIGRLDHQVKIRGHRIELGEIEQALLRCQDVREAVITAPADPAGERRLVAYVAGTAGRLDTAALSQQLQQVLPAYMLPAAWVVLDAFPLNPNGKIDRAALPAPLPAAAPSTALLPQAACPELATVLEILSGLLPGIQLAPDDDLFGKGLHSIAMMRFVSQCQERLGVSLKVRDVYRLATAGAIAQAVMANRRAA